MCDDEPAVEATEAAEATEASEAIEASEATDLFLSLTPERVLEAVEASGLACRPVCYPLNSFENRVYEVELEDRSRIVAKFYRPGRWNAEQILEEHSFLAELDAEEIPVCTVRPFPDGETLRSIEDVPPEGGEDVPPDRFYYSLADRRGGRAPDELGGATIERLGMFIGRMHNVGAARPAPSRPHLDADHYVRRVLRWMERNHTLAGTLKRRYFAAAEAIADIADDLLEGVTTHRIHADLHLGNVLLRDGELRVLDFDDMATGPAVQDLWLALPGRGREMEHHRDIFIAGYERFRPFDRATLRLIEPLRGLRLVRYTGWLARRWDDPAFRAGWPHFGTDEYWERETSDLEEQLAEIRRSLARHPASGPLADHASVAPLPEEEALTNKDYFWDWEGD
ncbi:MAG: serine/threonine protein kinase [bacterium]|nr:serine/threonine protein kinase [bacterium]